MAAGVTLLALAPDVALVVLGGFLVGARRAPLLVLLTPMLLAGPDATRRLSRATAVSSAAGVMAPAVLGAVDLTGRTGRTALLLVVVPLVALAAVGRGPAPIPSTTAVTGRRRPPAWRGGGRRSCWPSPSSSASSCGVPAG